MGRITPVNLVSLFQNDLFLVVYLFSNLLDGWEAIRQIRVLPAPLGQTPIIAFTAYTGGQEEQRARQAGCDEYLTKPLLDRRALQQTVLSLLARGPRP